MTLSMLEWGGVGGRQVRIVRGESFEDLPLSLEPNTLKQKFAFLGEICEIAKDISQEMFSGPELDAP